MEQTKSHPALEMRIKTLGTRIAELQRKIGAASDVQRLGKEAELKDLERRRRTLNERLRHLDGENPGLRQSVEAELALLADDIAGAIDDFVFSIDAHYDANREAKRTGRS